MADQLPLNAPLNSPSFPSSPPSPLSIPAELDAWANDLIDFPAYTEGSHRRAFSDSIIDLEPPATANPTMLFAPPSNHNNVNDDNHTVNVNPPQGDNSSAVDTLQLPIRDPKRVKRILANRMSARRSRERKLQYISKLQKCVGKFETEVATLTPRVAFFDRQRSMLVMQNSHIKQRIAVLAQENFLKHAYKETLKKEIRRLNQLHHQQNLTQTDEMKATMAATGDDTTAIFY